jgi:glycosyltransferase involved in cell wall biosynthesis
VAVIIACLDEHEVLVDAVRSAQGCRPGEVVVVDDGSTDADTLVILHGLATEGVRVLRQPNAGLPAARMAGLRATRAPYVFPLDADDLLLLNGLSALAATLDTNPQDAFSFGDYTTFGAFEGRWVSPPFSAWAVTYGNFWPAGSLFRRSALLEVGGWQHRLGFEDWDLWMSFAERGLSGRHCGEIAYRRRLHPGRMLAGQRSRYAEIHGALRARHGGLFARRSELRKALQPPLWQQGAFPAVLGHRDRIPERVERWILRRRMTSAARRLGTLAG